MKAKTIIYLWLIAMSSICCKCFNTCEEIIPTEPVPTYEDAIITINSFRNDLLASAGSGAIALRTSQSARVGEVWILHECKSAIQNFSTTLPGKFSGNDYDTLTDNLTGKMYEFHWENSWTEKNSFNLDVKYEILEAVLKAAEENSKVHSLDVKLSFKDPQYVRINNISDLRDEYVRYLRDEGKKAEGNIIVSALIVGKMRMEYKAYNEKKETISLNLSLNTNKLLEELTLKPGYEYFKDKGSSGGFSVIEESGENSVVFAVEFFRIPVDVQDQADIAQKITEFCDGGETLVKVKTVNGYCLTNSNNIIDLNIESNISGDNLVFYWKNQMDITVTNFHYTLTVRNRNGQILGTPYNGFVIHTINPGVTLQSGSISTLLPGFQKFKLEDVEFKLDIVEAKNGFDIICN